MGHAAPNSLGGCSFRLVPRRPGVPGLFGGRPNAACSAEATGWWLPVLADPASGDAGGWCGLTDPSHSCSLGGQPRPQGVGKSVVDPRGAWIIRIGELDAGRQRCGDDLATTAQSTVRALVGALGQSLGHPGPAQAVLAERGGSGAGAIQ